MKLHCADIASIEGLLSPQLLRPEQLRIEQFLHTEDALLLIICVSGADMARVRSLSKVISLFVVASSVYERVIVRVVEYEQAMAPQMERSETIH